MTADRLEIYRDEAGKWRFRRRARNGEIGNPSQGYSRRYTALVMAVKRHPDVYRENVVDLTRGGLRVQSKALRWLRSREEG